MNSNSTFISNLYKSRKNLLTILAKQGYNIQNNENFSINEISHLNFTEQLDLLLNKEGKKVYIKYKIEKKITPKTIYEIIDELYLIENILEEKDDLIIIVKDKENDTVMKLLETFYKTEKIFITVFAIKSLLFNILDHDLVPEHRILTIKEKQNFLKNKGIQKLSQLPTISRFDPVAKAIGMRPNDICEIIRSNPISIEEKYYRVCS